ncbi:uncharacterized protein LOC135080590 isoform X1 [Ostrinia nubilalis]|uniref:uncharacterized protein LOC135080590 isoform X1 n=1 Tax=Ostrinia nubilalis TaxID=29057 RepID=UPI003082693D
MSIPPLVCSTPPPPEQCEDDKDPDDFEINYNLSQEDDNADYDYGNFSSFNHFQSSTTDSCQEIDKAQIVDQGDTRCNESSDKIHVNKIIPEENDRGGALEEDIIEDLDLKIDHEPSVGTTKHESEIDENLVKDLQSDIPISSATTQNDLELTRSNLESITLEGNDKTIEKDVHTKLDDTESEESIKELADTIPTNFNNDTVENNVTAAVSQEIENDFVQQTSNNDLDDFEDFQFISSDNKPDDNILVTAENPWENEDSQNDGFGDFTANFATNDEFSEPTTLEQPDEKDHDSEDDFGDFDEFQSVNEPQTNTSAPDKTLCEEVPVLNLQSTDSEHQIFERINEVMHSIFQQEVTESDNILDNRLEGSLGETWGYLLETDVRQPYIVNWNNSLAQKTLLKALCIDSRNILFGPKWSSSMPKFAANLSTAPLQPQKQSGQSNISETAHPDKAAMKSSWVDPFTSDGQEFTYAEALLLDLEHLMATLDQMAHNHSTLKISELLSHACSNENESVVVEPGPTDLDVFEASISSKPDKIYSNTLSIQPIRQINLPDTHIFTPTDSETPRSKTIHYDNRSAPAVLMPKTDNISPQAHNLEGDNDYWEFQDFRGASQCKDLPVTTNEKPIDKTNDPASSKDVTQKPNYTLETQVLQPVKVELIMPTLNWPNPGEVKETFDDFTDFMSNSSIKNDETEQMSENILSAELEVSKSTDVNKHNDNLTLGTSDKVDDDFEMFQSALPPQSGLSNMDKSLVHDKILVSHGANNLSDFDVVFASAEKDKKSENISLPYTRPIENATKKVENVSSMNELIFSSQIIPPASVPISNVLQPTIASPSGTKPNQQKANQILQPLSLESYSQINWPNPGIDLQDLSRFNPVESLQSLKSETINSQSKTASPVHSQKGFANQTSDDDIWGEFVSSKPKQPPLPKKVTTFADDDEWTDFVSSPSVNPHNGLNTISLNVHTNSSLQKSSNTSKYQPKANEIPLDIPSLNYITPKTTSQPSYNERHFQNL